VPEVCFLLAPRQNRFFVEIATALCDELEQLGVRASIGRDGFPPPRRGLVTVLVPPHEYVKLAPAHQQPAPADLRRTIFLCAEQPGSSFFDDDVALAAGGDVGAVLDVSADGVAEFRRLGIEAQHMPLGWTRTWSRVDFDAPEDAPARDVDVLHLGISSPKRALELARYAPYLARWNNRLILSDDHQSNDRALENFAVDDVKWDLLSRSRILLNVHVANRMYFEWQRVVQAICNGALVVSEHSSGYAPLEPTVHFITGRAETLGLLARRYLEREDLRAATAERAWRFLREHQPLSRSAELLAETAERVDARPVQPRPAPPPAVAPPASDGETRTRFPSLVEDERESLLRAALKDVRLDLLTVRRELRRTRLEVEQGGAVPWAQRVAETPAHAPARPRVSVLVPLYNHAQHVRRALTTASRNEYDDVEIVVVNDGSTDDSEPTVRRWLESHPHVPAQLLRHPVNRGLGAARNTALDFARGEFAFMLDADNELFPQCIGRLVDALDSDPLAAFAYSRLAMQSQGEPVGLRSIFPWRPERLREGNFVDAMALWRTETIRQLGGYTTDVRLHGWEDYELLCRLAEAGGRGKLVPEVLALYRVSSHSMLTLTDLSWSSAVSVISERCPRLMKGVEPPL
jgi:Glycosyl transferase family 2